jgi:hypothetical protein
VHCACDRLIFASDSILCRAFLIFSRNFIGTLDDHTEDNPDYLLLPLSAPGVRVDHGALLSVDDQSQQLTVQLRIKHREEWKEEEEADEYVLTGELAAATTDLQSSQTGEESKEETATTDLAAKACAIVQPAPSPLPVDDDDIVMSDSAPSAAAAQTSTVGTKRKSSDDADEMTTAKKLKVAQAEAATENSDGVIELD